MRWPRCWRGSGNSGNGSVISILQLRRYATCPSKQRRSQELFPAWKTDVKGLLNENVYKRTFPKSTCVYPSHQNILHLVGKFGEICAKAHHRMLAKVRSYEESQARDANIFLMSCKTELCAGWVLYSIYLLISQELRYCKPHSGRFSFPEHLSKTEEGFRMSVRVWLHSALVQSLLNLLLQVLCIGLPSSGGKKRHASHIHSICA